MVKANTNAIVVSESYQYFQNGSLSDELRDVARLAWNLLICDKEYRGDLNTPHPTSVITSDISGTLSKLHRRIEKSFFY